MANTSSAKGNPASKRMSNLKAKGQHPKQLRAKVQEESHLANKLEMGMFGFKNRKQVHHFRQTQKSA